MSGVFDFINAINHTKKDLIASEEMSEKDYVPFVVNRTLSYFTDTLLYANEMNRYRDLDKDLQFRFLLNSIRPKKRFSKWSKTENTDQLELISQYFECSIPKAKDYLKFRVRGPRRVSLRSHSQRLKVEEACLETFPQFG